VNAETPVKINGQSMTEPLAAADYVAPRKPTLLTVRRARYLAIPGQGEPGGERFTAAIGALYGVAFTVKMTRKFAGKPVYPISKLEALWFMSGVAPGTPREDWRWKLVIRTPDVVTPGDVRHAISTLLGRGKPRQVREVTLETIVEGPCVQMLHLGPYEREPETVDVMRAFVIDQGYRLTGLHHEIYLSDPRRVPPARLRTILRLPVRRAGR
jgi:hypothetical protein